MKEELVFVWFRRDLRLEDNAALYHALRSRKNVIPLFIFDTDILSKLETKQDRRVCFIYDQLVTMHSQLSAMGSTFMVRYGRPLEVFQELLTQYDVKAVYANHDYEPYAIARDNSVGAFLKANGVCLSTFKDQVIFEAQEILKDNGTPYTVFTPYSKKWKSKLNSFYLKSYPTKEYFSNFYRVEPLLLPTLAEIGFFPCNEKFLPPIVPDEIISQYAQNRDFPSILGTSRLSLHLRFGTVSIRSLARKALELSDAWLNELIWREFYMMILYFFPKVTEQSFKTKYDAIPWRNNRDEYEAWCKGMTGYPIVDAGMRELNATGFMHNRVRMIVASFLTKHLLIDWRWGEAYFAQKLLDFDLSANNGGWQWAAGTGCDAAPYFRVFNPYEQTKKFDPDLKYIRKWVPEFEQIGVYPSPIVDHKLARERALTVYKNALQE